MPIPKKKSKGITIRVANETIDRMIDSVALSKGWSYHDHSGEEIEDVSYDDVTYPVWTVFNKDGYKIYQDAKKESRYTVVQVNAKTTIAELIRKIPKALQPIMVGEDEVECNHPGYIQVGCKSISDDKIRGIVKRHFGITLPETKGG